MTLFRYGLIAPLVNEQVEAKTYLQELEGKQHDIPQYGERNIGAGMATTLPSSSYEALKPKKRADQGKSRRLSPDDQDHLLNLRKEVLYMPVTVFYEQLVKRGEIKENQISFATVNRLLKKHQLTGHSQVS